MDSDLRQRLKAAMPMHEQGQEEFQAQTGIDIERDIDYIVAAAAGVIRRQSGRPGRGPRPVQRHAARGARPSSTAARSKNTRASG